MLLDLPSEEVCIAMSLVRRLLGGGTSRAAEAGVELDLGYSVPQEGGTDWYDVMYLPSDAHLTPTMPTCSWTSCCARTVIARASNFIGYANANRDRHTPW